jgi:hypothetical protein
MNDPIFIGINNEVIELKGKEKEEFLIALELENKLQEEQIVKQSADKAALLTRLGITADEAKLLLS